MKRVQNKLNCLIDRLDRMPLGWSGMVLLAVVFLPYMILQEGSVFEIHDQLDESMMNYVLTARHLGANSKSMPELLGGINASGMQPSAVLFVGLYCLVPTFVAFLMQYGICFLSAFWGMYLCVKELTGSSILAVAMGGCFCMLPLYPVYGLSQYGIPLLLYAFLCLWKQKHRMVSLVLVAFFGLTSHLVYTGYAVLGLWGLALLVALLIRKRNCWIWIGFGELLAIYIMVNIGLFQEILLGGSTYISHREEFVNYAMPFWKTLWEVFLNSAQHAPSLHKYMVLPILVMLVAGAFLKKNEAEKTLYAASVAGMVFLVGIAFFYALCKSAPIVEWKNSVSGFLHYFQVERFYWLYPAAWYLEFALLFAVWWRRTGGHIAKLLLLVVILLPTLNLLKTNSMFYMNVNQINNGSGITGYISWESYYAEELMQQLEDVIGREKSEYRVAHLGISPAPSLMHGFYTVDGYSNNYPLEYKHQFRQIIAKELEKNEETRLYFDEWGNRCYLFNGTTGTYWSLAKNSGVRYENLEFDMNALRSLGCEYLFSGGEIVDADRMGLSCRGYYETEDSYWGIWLYELDTPQ